MKIVGLLSWYDEKHEHLAEAILSLGRVGVSHLVAVDGAYALYPDARGYSGAEQHDTISAAAAEAGMGCTIHTPNGPWAGNEMEKRSLLFALGHVIAAPHEDWLFVLDADEIIAHAGDYLGTLAITSCDVGAVLHGEQGVRPRSERRLFRAHPGGINVTRAHYYYRDGDDRVLWGPGQIDRELVDIRIHHRPTDRPRHRLDARDQYYDYRLQANAEVGI